MLRYQLILAAALFIFVLGTGNSFGISSTDTLRNELGGIIVTPPPGAPGVNFAKAQFIASLQPGYLTLPRNATEARLDECNIEHYLLNLLQRHHVTYVNQVFPGRVLGDTIRMMDSGRIYVPDLSQIYLFIQDKDSDELQAIEDMYSIVATLYAEPNFIREPTRSPVDTYWGNQWNLKGDDYNGIGCQSAWDVSVGSPTIKLAIIDSGVNYNHPDLGGPGFPNSKVAGGWDYGDNDNDPMDYCDQNGHLGHGSECAGVAGALTNNSSFVSGIAGGWHQSGSDVGIKIYALKIEHNDCSWAGDNVAANAIVNAADPNAFGCQILSNSWGGVGYSETIRSAINFAYRIGVSFVAAKGNNGNATPFYPADYDNSWVTAVAAYGQDGRYCQDGNCNYTSNYGGGIDITAPGTAVPTTNRLAGIDPGFNGTSAACPHVAGSIGLIRSKKSGLYNEDTEWILKFSAYDLPVPYSDGDVWTWNERYGHGDLRISTAMLRLGNPYIYCPFKLVNHTATGGFEASHTGFMTYTFLGSPLNGTYSVRRYDVRVNVTYPETWDGIPFVWGLGQGTNSWSAANPSYQVGYCGLVPGTQTATGCQLQTFVYDVYDLMGGHVGWYPCHVNQVSLNYRNWGTLHVGNPQILLPKTDASAIPTDFGISAIYPNPFNSDALIKFGLPQEAYTSLEIYDLLGRKVLTLFEGNGSAGDHAITWHGTDQSGKDMPSGIYFCKLSALGEQKTQKITLLR
jgi:thermitase